MKTRADRQLGRQAQDPVGGHEEGGGHQLHQEVPDRYGMAAMPAPAPEDYIADEGDIAIRM